MQNIYMQKEACQCKKACWFASEMDFELFISEVEKRPAIWDQINISIRTENPKKARLRLFPVSGILRAGRNYLVCERKCRSKIR